MIFVGFGDRDYLSPFPNVWYCVGVQCCVVDVCEVPDGSCS